MRKLRSIQVLRGVAACAVVFHHAYGASYGRDAAPLGAAGVDLFFVISGFIMATIGPGRTPTAFITDRVWRIFPLWLIAVAPWLLIAPHDWQTTATSLTLWPIWGGSYYTPALLVGWTLCFEMLFYAAFAIGLATRPVIPIIAFAVCLLLGARTPFLAFVGSPLILEFLAGILIAKLPPTKLAPVLILASALWFAIAPTDYYTATYGSHAALRVIAWGIPAAFLVYGALSVETLFAGRLFAIPVLVGNASYSIYLLGIVTFTHPVPPDAENSGFSSREVLANSRHSPLRN